ncbi:hypothetical protein OQZ33_17065 [Pedobacter sp. MC2016-05]|uniref:hypothetical protein n=1 Tax=Pedobacter sp. MC2016-05 TaxID=2994474 RepID=UPI0022454F8C|nr:hypothetical protein [Pedobacter sp. MC2016-05]MCX2476047.1 hypothetical protein [Pedobacter sp. MC2016-05]
MSDKFFVNQTVEKLDNTEIKIILGKSVRPRIKHDNPNLDYAVRQSKKRTKAAINATFESFKTLNLSRFVRELRLKGIICEVQRNPNGKVIAVSFKEIRTEFHFQGWVLGSHYTMSAITKKITKHAIKRPNAKVKGKRPARRYNPLLQDNKETLML